MRLVLPLHVLMSVPLWIQAPVYYLLSIGIIWMLRDYQEGVAYNVARSSQFGDAALFTIILMAVNMLQDGRPVPGPLNLALMQALLLIIAVLVGVIWYFWFDPTPRWGDKYHHLVVAPMLVYLGINAAVIIVYAGKGWEISVAIALLSVWGVLVDLDVNTGRLNQRQWLKEQGVTGLKY